MLIRIIRKNINSQLIALSIISIILFIINVIDKQQIKLNNHSISFINDFFEYFNKLSLLSVLFALIIILVQSFVFNSYLTNHNLVAKRTYLPALISLMLFISFMGNKFLNPVLCSSFLLIILLKYLLVLYEKKEPFQEVLNIGLYIALLTFFNPSFIWLLLFVWLILIFFNIKSWREYLILIIGFAIPYFFVLCISYLNGNLNTLFIETQSRFSKIFIMPHFYLLHTMLIIVVIAFGLISIITIFFYNRKSESLPIIARKKMIVFFVFLLFLLFIWITSNHYINYLMIVFIPISVYISSFFQHFRNKWFGESMFVLFLVVIVLFKIISILEIQYI